MTVKLHIDSKGFKRKPQGHEIGAISKRIVSQVVDVTPQELSKFMSEGHTAVLATMNGERKKDRMEQQQVLMLDFDNTETIIQPDGTKKVVSKEGMFQKRFEDILEDPFIKENASFVYKTLSHTDQHHKFRVVFVLDRPLTSLEAVYGAYGYLLNQYEDADKACKDPSRLFFGGIEAVEIDFNNFLKADTLPLEVIQPTKIEKPVAVKSSRVERSREAKPEVQSGAVATWKLIKEGNTEEVKKRLSVYGAKLHSKVQVANYLTSIDMRDILGLYHNPTFDIFHYENSPSASIFKMEDSNGTWLYKCHSSSHAFTGDIVHVVARLLENGTYIKALNYLMDVCSIEIEVTEQIQELRDQCDLFTNMLLSESLKVTYPAIHERFWRYKTDINAILSIFKENIYEDENGNLRSLTWMSVRSLSEKLYGTDAKRDKISRLLNLLCYTNWIDKLDEDQIPPVLLKKLKETQRANNREKRSNVFELLNLGDDFFKHLSTQCEEMKGNGFTMKGFSKEYVARTNGMGKANEVFVQDKKRGLSKVTDKFASHMHKLIMEAIEEDGVAVEKDILVKMQKKYRSKGFTERKFKQCISEALELYCLERKRLTKDLREKYTLDIPQKSMPVVLVRAS